jgi:hypothetical protein
MDPIVFFLILLLMVVELVGITHLDNLVFLAVAAEDMVVILLLLLLELAQMVLLDREIRAEIRLDLNIQVAEVAVVQGQQVVLVMQVGDL